MEFKLLRLKEKTEGKLTVSETWYIVPQNSEDYEFKIPYDKEDESDV